MFFLLIDAKASWILEQSNMTGDKGIKVECMMGLAALAGLFRGECGPKA